MIAREQRLLHMVTWKGPWERLASFFWRTDGRPVEDGTLRDRLALWCDQADHRWHRRHLERGSRPLALWKRKGEGAGARYGVRWHLRDALATLVFLRRSRILRYLGLLLMASALLEAGYGIIFRSWFDAFFGAGKLAVSLLMLAADSLARPRRNVAGDDVIVKDKEEEEGP